MFSQKSADAKVESEREKKCKKAKKFAYVRKKQYLCSVNLKKVLLWKRKRNKKKSRKLGELREKHKEQLSFTTQSTCSMRYMLDTCTFLYFARDFDCLDKDVAEILRDPCNLLCVSAETACELVQGFNCGKFTSKRWKTSQDLIRYLDDFGIQILPIDRNVVDTYSHLEINVAQDHKDPFDHIIIAHAITTKIPLISSDHKFKFYCDQGLQLIFNTK